VLHREGRYRAGRVMMTYNGPMTAEQAATLKRLAKDAYELDAYKPNLTRAEADKRIAMLTAKLKLLDGPPHTL
jgi:Protein of unknown function (DUF3072)